MGRYLSIILTVLSGAALAEPVSYAFEWQGGDGYRVKGALEFDPAAVSGPFVLEDDLSCFVIEGTKDGAPIGRWALTMLNEQTTWRLHFDPQTSRFLVDGEGIWMPQAWNMNGEGVDCGPEGFGFNIGNAAQDICLDGTLVVESQVAPTAAFPASKVTDFSFPRDACKLPDLLSLLDR